MSRVFMVASEQARAAVETRWVLNIARADVVDSRICSMRPGHPDDGSVDRAINLVRAFQAAADSPLGSDTTNVLLTVLAAAEDARSEETVTTRAAGMLPRRRIASLLNRSVIDQRLALAHFGVAQASAHRLAHAAEEAHELLSAARSWGDGLRTAYWSQLAETGRDAIVVSQNPVIDAVNAHGLIDHAFEVYVEDGVLLPVPVMHTHVPPDGFAAIGSDAQHLCGTDEA